MQAQTLSGTVTDTEDGKPLEAVMLGVIRGDKLIDYALTDERGHYSLKWHHEGTLQLSVSLLGYRKEMHDISGPGRLDLALKSEAVVLKEVQIRPGRISTRKDTVRYDLSKFATERDVHIKDVLKRLPGVDVEESGQVKYKGKPIDHFLVEGMDVTGGRYNQINNNLNAKAVKSAEIMENYQSVKALKGKINSDEVALNLKLDPKLRDQWIWNSTLGTGCDDDGNLLWEAALNALQLGKGRQSVYGYKSNNRGIDLNNEQAILTGSDTRQEMPLDRLLSLTDISTPLDKRRMLFNETHTLNANRMYRSDDERTLRLQAGYTHDRRQQRRETQQLYYQPEDTIGIDETSRYLLRTDAAHLEAHYEANLPTRYLSNRLLLEGEDEQGTSPELGQVIRAKRLEAKNLFQLISNNEGRTWEVNSLMRYAYAPSRLELTDGMQTYGQQNFYCDHSAGYLRKRNGFSQRYTVGLQGEWNQMEIGKQQHTGDQLSLYFTPYFQLERGKWLATLQLPLRHRHYLSIHHSYLLFNPSLYVRLRQDYHWQFSLYGSLNRSAGSTTELFPFAYRTDYRTWRRTEGILPLSTNLFGRAYAEYKNTVQEFFVTAAFSLQQAWHNTLSEQQVSADSTVYVRHRQPNRSRYLALDLNLSKGFYDWNLKSSLNLTLSRYAGTQLTRLSESTGSLLQRYRYDQLKAEAQLLYTPLSALEIEYQATIGYGGSRIGSDTRLTPLLNSVQRLRLTVSSGRLYLRLSGEHYRNDLDNRHRLITWLADVSIIYKVKRWRLEGNLNNLFNQKSYAYTRYSATQSYTSRLGIRPREATVTAGYQF